MHQYQMTTSHRPQLEARNGSKTSYVPTSTQHARLLPGHTQLKYRKRKAAFDDKEHKMRNTSKPGITTEETAVDIEIKGYRQERDNDSKEYDHTSSEEENGEKEKEDGDDHDEEDYEEDDEEDDEDQEALLRELNKIRQERMVQKLKKQQIEEEEQEVSGHMPTVKKNWRSTSVFGRHKKVGDLASNKKPSSDKDKYVNDLTKSEYHQDFLHKYVK